MPLGLIMGGGGGGFPPGKGGGQPPNLQQSWLTVPAKKKKKKNRTGSQKEKNRRLKFFAEMMKEDSSSSEESEDDPAQSFQEPGAAFRMFRLGAMGQSRFKRLQESALAQAAAATAVQPWWGGHVSKHAKPLASSSARRSAG